LINNDAMADWFLWDGDSIAHKYEQRTLEMLKRCVLPRGALRRAHFSSW
jgi:hypothetical protein